MEEFTNFSRYIAQIEKKIRKKYGSENVGICKVNRVKCCSYAFILGGPMHLWLLLLVPDPAYRCSQVVPPEGWYKPYYDPHMTDEEAALTILDKFDYLKILPIRQCPNGNRGSYQLALVSFTGFLPKDMYLMYCCCDESACMSS